MKIDEAEVALLETFLWCILNAYKIDVVVYFFNMV